MVRIRLEYSQIEAERRQTTSTKQHNCSWYMNCYAYSFKLRTVTCGGGVCVCVHCMIMCTKIQHDVVSTGQSKETFNTQNHSIYIKPAL